MRAKPMTFELQFDPYVTRICQNVEQDVGIHPSRVRSPETLIEYSFFFSNLGYEKHRKIKNKSSKTNQFRRFQTTRLQMRNQRTVFHRTVTVKIDLEDFSDYVFVAFSVI